MKKLFALLFALALLFSVCLADGLTSFTTYDMGGNTVTEEIFAPYDLTIVNIWETWCGYCVREMPELQELWEILPENMNFITICNDASIEIETAYEILHSCGARFTTLIGTQEIYDQYLNQVYALPTTVFMDSRGNVVGEPIVGVISLGDDAAELYMGVAEEVLASMNG